MTVDDAPWSCRPRKCLEPLDDLRCRQYRCARCRALGGCQEVEQLDLFAVGDQQNDPGDDYRKACPARNDGRLLFGNRKSERPELAFVRFRGVFEMAVKRPRRPATSSKIPTIFVAPIGATVSARKRRSLPLHATRDRCGPRRTLPR